MSEEITVGAVSADGEGAVDLPVVELLTGRGFVTGKSGSGKSNTASVVAEKLLDRGLSLLIVDIDGEYYGLKEEYEILHVGADEECDIQVSPEHAGKIAELALEKHVPIILDISSFLDESKAKELLLETARHLFAKEKKKKQPFLLVVEEIHEWLPEGGGLDECGRMLIKVAKRGRKHGLGICGISQRPADVKKDFITQCDWLVWHRLTWGNDTKVVQRILGSDYADWVEDLNDGEGFLMTDWDEDVRQVQFQRKRTFDAGATPGLDDFERPELKSVSGDLVSDLQQISEDKQARQSRIQELERELKDRELRIEQLEAELKEARDLSKMAEQFSRAMMAHATGRPFRTDVTGYQADLEESACEDRPAAETPPDDEARPRPRDTDPDMTAPDTTGSFTPAYEPWPDELDVRPTSADNGAAEPTAPEPPAEPDPEEDSQPPEDGDTGAWLLEPDADGIIVPGDDAAPVDGSPDDPAARSTSTDEDPTDPEPADAMQTGWGDGASATDSVSSRVGDAHSKESTGGRGVEREVVGRLRERIEAMDAVTRGMLGYYRERGPASPLDAHVAAGGDGERTRAYGRNRQLREAGLIHHAGRGRYGYALPSLVDSAHDGRLDDEELSAVVAAIEESFLERPDAPWPTA
jgi:hypothetical protein